MNDINVLIKNGVNLKKSLELFGDIETYNNTIMDFYKELKGKLSNLKNYKENGDMLNYSILVHSLKSDARYFGFDTFASFCEEHELKSKSNDVYYVSTNFDSLVKEGIKTVEIIKEYIGVNDNFPLEHEFDNKKVVNGKILVVDDSDIISNFINSIFNNTYEVISIKDGTSAINILSNNENNIDGMLLDLNLPGVNGYEVLEFMQSKNLFEQINVAIITGSDINLALQNTKKYKISAIVEKPFNEASIKNVVEKLIKKGA